VKTAHTQLISVRLPFAMLDALKSVAEAAEKPWQTVMKSLLSDALGLDPAPAAERQVYSAPHLRASRKKLKKR